MTPKEKAKDIWDKMIYHIMYNCQPTLSEMVAKQCALVAVEEILNENSIREGDNDEIITYEPYWLKVKQEIQML